MALPPLTEALQPLLESLETALHQRDRERQAGPPGRRPVQVLYGGAHLFRPNAVARLGELARAALETYAPDGPTFAYALGLSLTPTQGRELRAAVVAKLEREPVEDLRIDFEDGYGARPDAEEDRHGEAAGTAVLEAQRNGVLPPFIGVRLKPLVGRWAQRSLRTLDLFASRLGPELPPGFAVTLPKVSVPVQVELLRRALEAVEHRLGWPAGSVAIELMVETPAALVALDGRLAILNLVEAAGGRCRSVHVGPYDLTSALGISGANQWLGHPMVELVRRLLQLALAGTGVTVADGPTTLLPVGPHKEPRSDQERAANRDAVFRAWARTADDIRRAYGDGIVQGWDLHPAQLPARYGTLFAMLRGELPGATARLRQFLDQSAQATRLGAEFDDAATARGLLNSLLRAIECGAASTAEVETALGHPLASARERLGAV
jgi:citrate lyase beta subunit